MLRKTKCVDCNAKGRIEECTDINTVVSELLKDIQFLDGTPLADHSHRALRRCLHSSLLVISEVHLYKSKLDGGAGPSTPHLDPNGNKGMYSKSYEIGALILSTLKIDKANYDKNNNT